MEAARFSFINDTRKEMTDTFNIRWCKGILREKEQNHVIYGLDDGVSVKKSLCLRWVKIHGDLLVFLKTFLTLQLFIKLSLFS